MSFSLYFLYTLQSFGKSISPAPPNSSIISIRFIKSDSMGLDTYAELNRDREVTIEPCRLLNRKSMPFLLKKPLCRLAEIKIERLFVNGGGSWKRFCNYGTIIERVALFARIWSMYSQRVQLLALTCRNSVEVVARVQEENRRYFSWCVDPETNIGYVVAETYRPQKICLIIVVWKTTNPIWCP
jgi:hypothetical protein